MTRSIAACWISPHSMHIREGDVSAVRIRPLLYAGRLKYAPAPHRNTFGGGEEL